MRRVLDIKHPPKRAFLNSRKVNNEHRIHKPKPHRPKKSSQNSSGEDLSNCVVTQIHPRIHGEKRHGPKPEMQGPLARRAKQPIPFISHEREVNGEEEHVLRVTRRPAMRVAHLEESTGLGASLLYGGFDELVHELGDNEAESEEHALEFAAEDEVGDEAAEADENWDQGNPG